LPAAFFAGSAFFKLLFLFLVDTIIYLQELCVKVIIDINIIKLC